MTAGSSYGMSWGSYGGELEAAGIENGLAVHGINDVYDVLEQISLNKMRDVDYVECSACSGGCIGGPLTAENKFVAEKNLKLRLSIMRQNEPDDRLATMAQSMICEDFPKSASYVKKLIPRPMMQLDDDILEAMKSLKRWRRSSDLCRGLIVEHVEHQAVNAWRKTSFRGKPMKLTVF